jgi:hypothetical protein
MLLPEKLQAARLRLQHQRPYLAAALYSLVPVERRGLGTLAVDRWWRLYFDPEAVAAWDVKELAGVLYHEVTHLLRAHHERFEHADREVANVAADIEINDDIRAERVQLPEGALYPETFGFPEGLLAEEYYSRLLQQQGQQSAAAPQQQQGQRGSSAAAQGSGGQGNGQQKQNMLLPKPAAPVGSSKGSDTAAQAGSSDGQQGQQLLPLQAVGKGGSGMALPKTGCRRRWAGWAACHCPSRQRAVPGWHRCRQASACLRALRLLRARAP